MSNGYAATIEGHTGGHVRYINANIFETVQDSDIVTLDN